MNIKNMKRDMTILYVRGRGIISRLKAKVRKVRECGRIALNRSAVAQDYEGEIGAFPISEVVNSALRQFVESDTRKCFKEGGRFHFCELHCNELMEEYLDTDVVLEELYRLLNMDNGGIGVEKFSPKSGDAYESAIMCDIGYNGFTQGVVSSTERIGLRTSNGRVLFKAYVKL